MSGARGGRGSIGIGGGGGRYQLRAMDLHVPQQRLQQQQFQQQLPQPLSGLPQLQPEVLPQQDQGLPQQAQVLPQHQQQHGENSAMSARHMLIRRKLMERKRFDSADYAMDKNKRKKEDGADEHDVPDTSMGSGTEPGNAVRAATAQAGASALYSALHDGSGEQDAVMAEAEPQAPSPAEAEAAERYGGLTRGGAASARHILLQKKLREKKHFDSADYQLARAGSGNSSPASPASPASGDSGAASPMDVDDEVGDAVAAVDNINSPSAALRADHRVAQMSPSVRAAKYGGLDKPSGGSDRLRLRQRLADKSAEQYRRSEAAASSPSREEQDQGRFFVPAASNSPVAAGRNAVATESGGGASRYGRLCAANVLIRRKLKERKRFDSADYAMQKDGEVEAAAEAEEEQGGSAGAIVDGQVVMTSPTPPHRHHPGTDEAMFFAQEGDATTSPSISHQVKHIKLSEGSGGGGWAGVLASKASMAPPPVPMEMAAVPKGGPAPDARLAARNLILQRKLAQKKRFDSADYYKARPTSSS